jgi:mono/diheme cytochrome c family protein
MNYLKIPVLVAFTVFALAACMSSGKKPFVIAESKTYEASLFRQNCAICHGPEANGRTLGNGVVVPSLRDGQFKALTEAAIENQIANGGNGMVPFRGQLTQRELDMMTRFVYHDLRGR